MNEPRQCYYVDGESTAETLRRVTVPASPEEEEADREESKSRLRRMFGR